MSDGKSTSEAVQGDVSLGNAHDPACPCSGQCGFEGPCSGSGCGCHCEGIAIGRADEREKAVQRVEQGVLGPEGIIFGCPFCGDPWESEPSCEHWHVIERLAAAVRGES